jgi:hypothetical protein
MKKQNSPMIVNLGKTPAELHPGLKELAGDIPLKFSGNGIPLLFVKHAKGLELSADADGIKISYETVNDAFRGLGLLQARTLSAIKAKKICEFRRLKKCFVMLDVSRNGVLNMKSIRRWLRFFALAGINGFMFYTEDTYEVEGEPFFGYMRGHYSKEELRTIDKIADSLGIEMIPCIQTLAHLQRILQYGVYENIKDTTSVMLCEEKTTLDFIEKMLKNASEPYKSKRIHIGMDEAWDLGRGKYLTLKGYKDPFDMMIKHMSSVLKITEKLGLRPMMWSDMFFRALSKTGEYYDTKVQFTKEMLAKVPKNVELVYWDYYHFEEAFYSGMIEQHVKLNAIPIMAPGIHTWNRFWAAISHSEETMRNAMKSCLAKGVQEMIITIWGDDGTECDYFSALPLIQLASDMIFTGKTDVAETEINLKGTLGIDLQSWRKGEKIDRLPGSENYSNISKGLLWDDPLLGLWQPQKNGKKLNDSYAKVAAELKKEISTKTNKRLTLPYLLADLLSIKADFPEILQAAYLRKDKKKLKEILSKDFPVLIAKIKRLNLYHRELWLENYKPFGWEVIERRYGGLLGVCDRAKSRLKDYLDGKIESIDELEEKRRQIISSSGNSFAHMPYAERAYSTGQISH